MEQEILKKDSQSRLGYMDIAKGIAILAVIVGHVNTPGITARVIYSFHLPLFFLVSGFFVKEYEVEKNFIKSCKGLLLPYGIGVLLEMMAAILQPISFGDKVWAVRQLFFDMLGGMCKSSPKFPWFDGTWELWFLPCLFVARNLFVVLMNLTDKIKYKWIVRTALFLFLASIGHMMSVNSYYPWGLEIAFVTLPFLYCGNVLRKLDAFSWKYRYWIALPCLILWGILLWQHFYLELAMHYYPHFYLEIFEAVAASFFVICFSQLLDKTPFFREGLRWVGNCSLILLLVHNVDMRYDHWENVLGSAVTGKWYLVVLIRIAICVCVAAVVRAGSYWWKNKRKKAE